MMIVAMEKKNWSLIIAALMGPYYFGKAPLKGDCKVIWDMV
jgi:hypothetical protein